MRTNLYRYIQVQQAAKVNRVIAAGLSHDNTNRTCNKSSG